MAKTPTRRKTATMESVKREESKPKLVQMQREDGKTADVHPEMVEHYRKGGYAEV